MRLITSSDELAQYDAWVRNHPAGSLWQSLAWKAYQEALGREVRIYVNEEWEAGSDNREAMSAMIVIDRTTGGFSTWEIGRGPLWGTNSDQRIVDSFMEYLFMEAKKHQAISFFFSPPSTLLLTTRYPLTTSSRHIHPEATRILDLTQSEEEILKQMKPKGRYNIKVAEKHGVTVEKSDDIDAYYALATKTADRDGFTIQRKNQYAQFLKHVPNTFLLLAKGAQNKEAIAGLIGVVYGDKGIYYYGASDNAYKAMMAPYLLQLAAIRHCKAAGCATYDLLGVAPPDAPADHPWQGISGFKEKFGGAIITYPAEQEIVLRPWVKRALMMKRKILG